mgnify:CR=1 FL=1
MIKTVAFAYHNIGVLGLNKLIKYNYNIKLVITHLDSNKENLWFKSVAEICRSKKIKFIYFEKSNFKNIEKKIKLIKPDYIFSFYFRKIFPKEILNLAMNCCINIHGSYLPNYRGAAPLNWQLINGETTGGVTLHKINEKIDAGKIISQKSFKIFKKDNPLTLSNKIIKTSNLILDETLPFLDRKIRNSKSQILRGTKVYKKRNEMDGEINWMDSSISINNLIRGVSKPYPGAFTYYNNKKIVIWVSRIDYTKKERSTKRFGYFYKDRRYYKVITGKGILTIIKMNNEYFLPKKGRFNIG